MHYNGLIARVNHVSMNKFVAANMKEYSSTIHSFKKTILSKNNDVNLHLVKESRETQNLLDRSQKIDKN